MRILNLRREFKAIKVKEIESANFILNKLSKVVTQIRLLGEQLIDQQLVEITFVCLSQKFLEVCPRLEKNIEGVLMTQKCKTQGWNSSEKKPYRGKTE